MERLVPSGWRTSWTKTKQLEELGVLDELEEESDDVEMDEVKDEANGEQLTLQSIRITSYDLGSPWPISSRRATNSHTGGG